MKLSNLILIIFLTSTLDAQISAEYLMYNIVQDNNKPVVDTFPEYQFLFNGRIWRDQYIFVEGDQFFVSKEPMPGSVTMRGRTYSGIRIMYDIFNDEILIPYKPAGILQLNKEMVDSFSIQYPDHEFNFVRIADGIYSGLNGYFHVLYNGQIKLYEKYGKKIEKFAEGGKYDKFYQVNKIFMINDGIVHLIKGKNDLIRIFNDKRKIIRNYIKNNNLRISKTRGESYIPVIEYIDKLKR